MAKNDFIFDGSLNKNRIFTSYFNMITHMRVNGTGIDLSGDNIWSGRKKLAGMYGDSYLELSTDIIKMFDYDPKDEDYTLLSQFWSPEPAEQRVVIDQFKTIPLTHSNPLEKQAFMSETTFSEHGGVILAWIGKLKEMFDHTYYNSNILTTAEKYSTTAEFDLVPDGTDIVGLSKIQYQAQMFSKKLEDLFAEMREPDTNYNELGFMRNYKRTDFDVVIPIGLATQITKLNIPFLFNPSEKDHMKEVHWKYFGNQNDEAGVVGEDNQTIRALNNLAFDKNGNPTKKPSLMAVNLLPGQLLPEGAKYEAKTTYTSIYTDETKPNWDEDFFVYLIHKKDFPILEAMNTSTAFFNPKTLSTNNYLHWGFNDVRAAKLAEYPLIKIDVKVK